MARKKKKNDKRPAQIRLLRESGLKWKEIAKNQGLSVGRCIALAKLFHGEQSKTASAMEVEFTIPAALASPTPDLLDTVEMPSFDQAFEEALATPVPIEPDRVAPDPKPTVSVEAFLAPAARVVNALVKAVKPETELEHRFRMQKQILCKRLRGEFVHGDYVIYEDMRVTGGLVLKHLRATMRRDMAQPDQAEEYVERHFDGT